MKPTLLAALVAALLLPAAAQAQRRPPATPVWTVGIRGGFDTNFNEEVFGVVTRIPTRILPRVSVQAAMDYTFLQALTEWQLSTDVVYDLGGLGVAAGPVFRNTRWADVGFQRETRAGFSVAGLVGGIPVGRLPVALGLEIRYARVDGFTPTPITIGVNLAPTRLF